MIWKKMSNATKALICVSFLVLLVKVLFSFMPALAERWYGLGLYPLVRKCLDCITWPVSGIYLLLFTVVAYMIYLVWRLFVKGASIRSRMSRFVKSILSLLAILMVWFYLIWGYNYDRPDILERMNVTTVAPDTTWIFSELREVISAANELRQSPVLSYLDDLNDQMILTDDLPIHEINRDLEAVLPLFKYDIKINPPFRFMEPAGVLLHWSTAGIYWPFSGESNVDRGVHLIKKPVTIAHELAHAHGLTSEGDCNFVAYLACVRSEDPLTQYSGQLSYLGYLMRDALKILGRDGLNKYYDLMNEEVRTDREKIYQHHNQYKDYFPKLRNKVYDSYLRSQGVKGGIASYNYFVKLKYNLVK